LRASVLLMLMGRALFFPCKVQGQMEKEGPEILYDRIGKGRLERVRLDGSPSEIVPTPGLYSYSHTWSGDGRWIAGHGIRDQERDAQVYLYEVSSKKLQWLTADKTGKSLTRWITGTSRLLFARGEFSARDLYLIEISDRKEELLLKIGKGISEAVVSPDGKRVVLSMGDFTSTDLQILDLESRKLTPVLADGRFNNTAVWAPDGRSLAFVTWIGGRGTIRLYDRESGKIQTLIERTESCLGPSWAPDGLSIAFLVDIEKDGKTVGGWLEVVNLQGKTLHKLGPIKDSFPSEMSCWSPEGTHLALVASRVSDGCHDLYVLSVDGKTTLRLTDTGTNAGSMNPCWRPRSSPK
jgi:TolB protein